jgi:hypothetical protein
MINFKAKQITAEEAGMAYLQETTAGGWGEVQNEKHHYFYSSLSINMLMKSRRIRWAGYVAHMEEVRDEYKILLRKPERKKPHSKIWA